MTEVKVKQRVTRLGPVVISDNESKENEDKKEKLYENCHLMIKNVYFDQYLCATNNYQDKFHLRRRISLNTLSSSNNPKTDYLSTFDECKWKLKKDALSSNSFELWNLKYERALYAGSFFYSTNYFNKRNVFLWHDSPDSDQFKWNFRCF